MPEGSDGDEVTTIATSALSGDHQLPEAGDDDVTTIVSGVEQPGTSNRLGAAPPDDETTTAIRTTVAVVSSMSTSVVADHRNPGQVDDGRPVPAKVAPPPATDSSTELSGPEDLLEADIDDSSARIHSVPPLQPAARVRKERRPLQPAGAPSSPTGPVISVPPKATHVAAAPSIVLRPEPVIHQEATKPAVRALKPPGVIQITYGTLIVAVLGIALMILLVVLLK
jgi:hypothetical protein